MSNEKFDEEMKKEEAYLARVQSKARQSKATFGHSPVKHADAPAPAAAPASPPPATFVNHGPSAPRAKLQRLETEHVPAVDLPAPPMHSFHTTSSAQTNEPPKRAQLSRMETEHIPAVDLPAPKSPSVSKASASPKSNPSPASLKPESSLASPKSNPSSASPKSNPASASPKASATSAKASNGDSKKGSTSAAPASPKTKEEAPKSVSGGNVCKACGTAQPGSDAFCVSCGEPIQVQLKANVPVPLGGAKTVKVTMVSPRSEPLESPKPNKAEAYAIESAKKDEKKPETQKAEKKSEPTKSVSSPKTEKKSEATKPAPKEEKKSEANDGRSEKDRVAAWAFGGSTSTSTSPASAVAPAPASPPPTKTSDKDKAKDKPKDEPKAAFKPAPKTEVASAPKAPALSLAQSSSSTLNIRITGWNVDKDEAKGQGEISYSIEATHGSQKSVVNKKLNRFKELYGKLKSDQARNLYPPGSASYPLSEINDKTMKPRVDNLQKFLDACANSQQDHDLLLSWAGF